MWFLNQVIFSSLIGTPSKVKDAAGPWSSVGNQGSVRAVSTIKLCYAWAEPRRGVEGYVLRKAHRELDLMSRVTTLAYDFGSS